MRAEHELALPQWNIVNLLFENRLAIRFSVDERVIACTLPRQVTGCICYVSVTILIE